MSAGATGGGDRGLTGSVWPTPPSPPARPPKSRLLTPAVAGSIVVLVVSAATSISWVVANGGVALPPRAAAPSAAVAAATDAPGPPVASPTPTRSPGTTAIPTTAPVVRTPSPASTPRPSPTSDRYALLVACQGTPDCYRYSVRAGDNLWSIARWFGVPLESVYERNPDLRTTSLRPGMQIELPAPTR